MIDAAYAEEIGRYNWHAFQGWRSMYAKRKIDYSRQELLHHAVVRLAALSISGEVDHKNGDGLDCRVDNLRSASKKQNAYNAPAPLTNTSGVKGVTLHRRTGKWQAQIRADGAYRYLGIFVSKDDAAIAVMMARRAMHGAFARDF